MAAAMNRKYAPLHLSEQEYAEIYRILDTGKHSSRTIKRAQVLRHLHEQSLNYESIAEQSGYKTTATICAIARRYRKGGLELALYDAPRPGQPSKFSTDDEARITAIACSEAPGGRSKWTLRLLAAKVIELELTDNVAPATIGSVLKKTTFNRIKRSNGALAS